MPQYVAGDSNSFAVTINVSGQVTIDYGDVDALDGITDLTEGCGVADLGSTDRVGGGLFIGLGYFLRAIYPLAA